MKQMLIVAAMLLGSVAMAQGEKPATPAESAPTASTPAAAPAKVSKKEAKKECLKGDKTLKGAKLSECVKSKMK